MPVCERDGCKVKFSPTDAQLHRGDGRYCSLRCNGLVGSQKRWDRDKIPLEERFWALVDQKGPNDCWEWIGTRSGGGYGRFQLDGKSRMAHRIAFEIMNGEDPGSLCVCHHCDNPPCVNPAHLFLGTHRDNVRDKMQKGRFIAMRGERHGASKLTVDTVREIRQRVTAGEKQTTIAQEFGVSKAAINLIVKRKNWRHIT